MFTKQQETALVDLSTDLCDETDWRVGTFRTFDFPLNVSSVAVEPLAGLIAVGTADGIVYVFGGPSVESKISLPEPVGVRFLHFSISTYFLLCFAENNQLHIYNLLEYGRPKIVTSARFDPTNSLTLSPSHTHVFLAMQNGDVKTYDLTCLRKSSCTVPNLWKLYERDLVAKGIPSPLSPAPQETVDTVVHPRNLNLLFIAYAGGVILMDLMEHNTVRAYELVLKPGAPGGAGYGTEEILTQRRSMVTSMAVHPTGFFFAVGYTDGSIAFWAVDDDTKPLVTRTLDDDDVDVVDQDFLQAHMSSGKKFSNRSRFVRQPVYKLSWSGFPNSSDPRGGETALTVLGGLVTPKCTTVTIFAFPAFNPAAPPVDNPVSQNQLHPEFRRAMYQSVMPIRSFPYEPRGPVQDFLLLPKDNPHFGGAFDPYAILLILDIENTRTVEAVEFPPPNFVCTSQGQQPGQPGAESPDSIQKQMLELKSRESSTPLSGSPFDRTRPAPLHPPFSLSNAGSLVKSGCLFTLKNDAYDNLSHPNVSEDSVLELKGGLAYTDSGQLSELKLSKYQPRRILFTHNEDKTVRFFDLSSTLLVSPENEPLKYAWPKPITSLTIHIADILRDASFTARSTDPDLVSIQSVQVASEALEVAISLDSGEVLIYTSTTRKAPDNSPPPKRDIIDGEIVLIDHIQSSRPSRLKPFFMLCAGQSRVQMFAISDIGFLAVSYRDGSLTIVDMRGPRIILSNKRHHKRRSQGLGPAEVGSDIVTSLTWSICPLDRDSRLRVRLIAVPQSGNGEIYTLVYSGNPASWEVMPETIFCKGVPDALPDCTFVLDSKYGTQLRTDPARLALAVGSGQVPLEKGTKCLLVSVGPKQVRVTANVNGEKVGKVELGSKFGSVMSSQVVGHNQSHALVLQTNKNNALAYSLPHLEHIATMHLPNLSPIPLTIDDTGDFIAWSASSPQGSVSGRQQGSPHINGATYGTFFDLKRAYTLPDVDFTTTRKAPPPQPQPVSLGPHTFLGGLGAWLPFKQTLSGEEIDELLGGPDRPVPEKIAREKARLAEDAADGGTYTGLAASAAAVQANFYNRLTGALGERGQLLGDLEERIQSLGEGSRSMAAQAKRLAAQQTAKSWFGF